MPSARSLQIDKADEWFSMEPECWESKGPIIEALRLLMLLETGATVDDVRRLITVPRDIRISLRAFIVAHPEDAFEIERALSFRQEAAKAFERFVSVYLVADAENSHHKAMSPTTTISEQRNEPRLPSV